MPREIPRVALPRVPAPSVITLTQSACTGYVQSTDALRHRTYKISLLPCTTYGRQAGLADHIARLEVYSERHI